MRLLKAGGGEEEEIEIDDTDELSTITLREFKNKKLNSQINNTLNF